MTEIEEIKGSRSRQELPVGVLAGWDARRSLNWTPSGNSWSGGILFGIRAHNETGNFAYWKDMAIRLRALAPSVQVVGLCINDTACGDPSDAERNFTVLEAMDPVYVHDLSIAAKEGRILLFRGSQVTRSIMMSEDKERLLQQIASLFPEPAIRGGN